MRTDKTFHVRIPNRRGMLAQVVSRMASTGVMLCNIKTRHIGRKNSYRRDITLPWNAIGRSGNGTRHTVWGKRT